MGNDAGTRSRFVKRPRFLSALPRRSLLCVALIAPTVACDDPGIPPSVASSSSAARVEVKPEPVQPGKFDLSTAHDISLGTYIADGSGRAVYVLDDDSSNGAACTQLCLAIWPPVAVGNAIPQSSDSAVLHSNIGVVTRDGGTVQITFRGRPLYYYLGDQKPGDTRGHHVEDSWGEWKLISPAGRPLSSGDGGRRSRSE